MNGKLLIVDGNSILNRAFYAIKGPRMLTKSDGTPTNAVFGFLNILNKYMEEENPDHLAVAFDLKGKTFRHEMYDGYKATRKGMPDELATQLPIVKQVLRAMNIAIIECEGLEADDLIGIYSKTAEDKGLDVSILTGDRDALQLASHKVTIIIPSTSKGQTTTTRYTPDEIVDKYGVEPSALIEIKALMGDSSDNIPGVKGVGEKTAVELVKKYGTLDKIYENLSDITRAKLKSNLEEYKDLAYLSRDLGTIVREKDDLKDISIFKRSEFNKEELLAIFKDLEFNSFIKKMGLEEDLQEEQPILEPACCEEINSIAELDKALLELSDKSEMALLPIFTKSEKVGGTLEVIGIGTREKYYFATTQKIDEELLCQALVPIFKNSDLILISHNIKELYTWALYHNTDIECNLFENTIII
jgi:DNA polymerase-1